MPVAFLHTTFVIDFARIDNFISLGKDTLVNSLMVLRPMLRLIAARQYQDKLDF